MKRHARMKWKEITLLTLNYNKITIMYLRTTEKKTVYRKEIWRPKNVVFYVWGFGHESEARYYLNESCNFVIVEPVILLTE